MKWSSLNRPPEGGWQPMVPELLVEDFEKSLDFWCGIAGFEIAYDRPEEKFAYLELVLRSGASSQIMLHQRCDRWETGSMEYPLGQGVMFQIRVDRLQPIIDATEKQDWPIYSPLRDIWRETGNVQSGQRELFLLDPDGYLLMLNEDLGVRPL